MKSEQAVLPNPCLEEEEEEEEEDLNKIVYEDVDWIYLFLIWFSSGRL
jgi:hypothetical protein